MCTGKDNLKNILCVRLDSLGDVLMTTPAFKTLRANYPEAKITLLTSRNGALLSSCLPGIDETIAYDAPWVKNDKAPAGRGDIRFIRELEDRHFDAAFIFTVFSQNPLPAAMMCYLADIPVRVAHCRENPYHLLSHWVKETEPFEEVRHEVVRQLALLEDFGLTVQDKSMEIVLTHELLAETTHLCEDAGVDLEQPFVILHPGATATSRRYSVDKFATVAKALCEDMNLQVVLTGSFDELNLAQKIKDIAGDNCHVLTGELTAEQFATAVSLSALVISNNTSAVHIASATKRPVVDIYALTNPQHTPWGVPSRVLFHPTPCGFCFKSRCQMGTNHCIDRVSPLEVVEAVRQLMLEPLMPFMPQTASGVVSLHAGDINPFYGELNATLGKQSA